MRVVARGTNRHAKTQASCITEQRRCTDRHTEISVVSWITKARRVSGTSPGTKSSSSAVISICVIETGETTGGVVSGNPIGVAVGRTIINTGKGGIVGNKVGDASAVAI